MTPSPATPLCPDHHIPLQFCPRLTGRIRQLQPTDDAEVGHLFCPTAGGHDAGWFTDSITYGQAQAKAELLLRETESIATHQTHHEQELVCLRSRWLSLNSDYDDIKQQHDSASEAYCDSSATMWDGKRLGCHGCAELCSLTDEMHALEEQMAHHETRLEVAT